MPGFQHPVPQYLNLMRGEKVNWSRELLLANIGDWMLGLPGGMALKLKRKYRKRYFGAEPLLYLPPQFPTGN